MSPTPLSATQRSQIYEMVQEAILPYRVRFYVMMLMLVITVLVAAFSYVRGQDDLQSAVHDNTCTLRALVVEATPLRPRPQTSGGHLHYTRAQKREILAARRDLLSVLPEASCAPALRRAAGASPTPIGGTT